MVLAMAGPEEQREFKFGWSLFRRAHQAIARRCHKKGHEAKHAGRHAAPREPDPAPSGTMPASPTARSQEEGGLLTDAEFERLRELLPVQEPGHGRPRRDDRQVLGAILWVMDTGASWRELPEEELGPNSTAHGRYRKWLKEGLWPRIVEALGRYPR
jgi:Putative transposase of IS4/5 family (DUF4096)